MQTMELVDIADVYPYEEDGVRMNPRNVFGKECREYIAQLAEQFRYNRLNPGQPRVRPILYRDGGIYMIVDGECRYEAMKLAGTRKFYADVFDDLADAETARREAAKAMVETDCKRPLTPEEMCQGVQTMLELGIPDEEVAAVARTDAGRVGRVRRASRAVGDAAYDMTIDRLLAIAEFDGDEEATARLRDCDAREWRRVYEALSADRRMRGTEAAVRAALEERGLSEWDGEAERVTENSFYFDSGADADALVDRVAGALEGSGCTLYSIDGRWVELIRPKTDEDRRASEAVREKKDAERREYQRHREMWRVEREAQEAWVAERMAEPRRMEATAALLADRAMERAQGFIGRTGAEVDFAPTPAIIAVGWAESWAPDEDVAAAAALGRIQVYMATGRQAASYTELAEAMAADGHEPNETGAAVAAALAEWKEKNGGR